MIDDKRIQKHLKGAYQQQEKVSFLEFKRDFYLKVYNMSSPLCTSFNRHVAWKLSGILYKLSVQSQNLLNIGEANEQAQAANLYFLKYKELTKQLSKHPDLEQVKYLQNRQFLTKERFEANRQRISQQLAQVTELLEGKFKGKVTAQFHQFQD